MPEQAGIKIINGVTCRLVDGTYYERKPLAFIAGEPYLKDQVNHVDGNPVPKGSATARPATPPEKV